ncbi:MAG TPA: hypothetical protein VEG61_01615 [Candidatus Dormibacteraeota bacterium]|nr:hypothetical protein [Candidatus Dormibacteraeota bacterium]
MPCNRGYQSGILFVILIITLPLTLVGAQMVTADQNPTHTETVELNVGDSLVLRSNRLSIQQIFLEGNLSAASVDKPSQYPTNYLELNASTPGTYRLQVIFNQASEYNVNLYVRQSGTNAIDNSTSFYVSGGSFELDVNAYFNPHLTETPIQVPSTSPWEGFANWVGSFGQAFPLWVKVLYMLLGVQFLLVGGLWIRRESARKEAAAQPLDVGDKAYLWLDVVYKFLLASFVAIVAIMGGELILLFVLRFMFLVSLNLLSLWDLFVVGFAAGAVIMVYVIRITFGKAFDLKPLEDE